MEIFKKQLRFGPLGHRLRRLAEEGSKLIQWVPRHGLEGCFGCHVKLIEKLQEVINRNLSKN